MKSPKRLRSGEARSALLGSFDGGALGLDAPGHRADLCWRGLAGAQCFASETRFLFGGWFFRSCLSCHGDGSFKGPTDYPNLWGFCTASALKPVSYPPITSRLPLAFGAAFLMEPVLVDGLSSGLSGSERHRSDERRDKGEGTRRRKWCRCMMMNLNVHVGGTA